MKLKTVFITSFHNPSSWIAVFFLFCFAELSAQVPKGFASLTSSIEDIVIEAKYKTQDNFTGRPVNGYDQLELMLTVEAIEALKAAQREFVQDGYAIKVFDAYRPQKAVDDFVQWAAIENDTLNKQAFYPNLKKSELFPLGYIAERSGHSRGSTLDLTLVYLKGERALEEVDMGGNYDYFGEASHVFYEDITAKQKAARMYLRRVMLKHGFQPYEKEWWHFTLKNEPYPSTYFDH